ncbi:hypothetical protein RZS08_11430, partial [Arthrospira platensis SPKY1]|nr:hypothetical protein [Arthrospira platensis SPKY1]
RIGHAADPEGVGDAIELAARLGVHVLVPLAFGRCFLGNRLFEALLQGIELGADLVIDQRGIGVRGQAMQFPLARQYRKAVFPGEAAEKLLGKVGKLQALGLGLPKQTRMRTRS